VSGTTTVGQTLSSTTGGWNGYPAPTYAYQWVRGASNIGGATSATYPLVDADYNNTIKVIVTATNSAGSANATSNATATIAGTVPGAPTIGTATAGNAQASVAFTAPAVTGGPAITSYTATSSPGGITGSAASSPITVTGLTNGTAYTFTVTATNSIGTGPASAASNSVTPSAAPVTDASFAYVPLLLETTSTNGQQNNTFLDSSTNNFTITRNGTPTQGSITPYWPNGQWSNYFDGDADFLNNGPTNSTILDSIVNVTTGQDGTFECWVYPIALTTASPLKFSSAVFVKGNIYAELVIDATGAVTWYMYNASDYYLTTAAGLVLTNTWQHIALVWTNNNVKIYINGTQRASGTRYAVGLTNQYFSIGRGSIGSATGYWNGYISNMRVVNEAIYTANFTPPTTPLTPITNTSLLTCQSNRFIDNSTNNYTFAINGTPRIQAFQPFSPTASYTTALYGGSGYFNGTGTDYLTYTGTALGSGNFTIEFWAYPIETRSSAALYDANNGLIIRQNSANLLIYDRTTNANFSTTGNLCVPSVWAHIAVVRNSGTITAYINGVSAGSMSDTSNFTGTGYFVSAFYDSQTSTNTFYGYLSNFRAVVGTAVYTGNFTPPTLAPLTTAGSTSAASYSSTTNVNTSFAASNTSLLLNMANAGIYDAAAQNDVTTVGDAQASTTQKQWGTTSMKYDGTGDWLTAVDNPQLQLGTGNFTIDGWVYLSAVSVAYGILSKGTATTGWSVNVTVLNKLQFSYTASNLTGTTTLATGTWYYFAVVRSGSATGNLKLYLNGSLEATSGGAVTDNFNQTNILYVGADRIGSSALNGYLQDIRITKGVARTVTTTPTAAFPVQ
jgi:hypothetical protein